jgi:hypothetical protein
MNSKTFYRLLRKTQDKLFWFVDKKGCIRAKVRKDSSFIEEMCPITAVNYLKTGDEYPACDIWFANIPENLGIDENVAHRIVASADKAYVVSNGHRIETNTQTRQALLRALNLSEAVVG